MCCRVCARPASPGGVLVFPREGQLALPQSELGFPALVMGLGALVALLMPVNSPFPVWRIGLDIVYFPCTTLTETNSSSFWENSSSLEKELKSEKEQRQALQRELQQEKDTSSLLRAELQQVEGLKKVKGQSCSKQLSRGGRELLASPGAPATRSPRHSQNCPTEPLLQAAGARTPAARGAVRWGE